MKKTLRLLVLLLFVGLFVVSGCSKTDKYDYLVLVNKYSQLPDDWEKNVELVDAKNAWDEDIKVEKNAYDNYLKLEKALEKEGVNIELDSVYRSVKAQQDLWDEWSADPEKGIDYVRKFVAVPGYSEHHTGLAIDICIRKEDGELEFDNDEMIADRETFAKIHDKLADYGFILRYLENREDSTGYTYEPWHLRYIGDIEIAKEIMKKKITLEEYLDSIEDVKHNHEAAKYKIETTLKEYIENGVYKDSIINSRFNVTKIYSSKDEMDSSELSTMGLSGKDIAFEVTYQLQPAEGTDINPIMVPDGEYNENLGWITNISRVGILKYNNKTKKYTIKNFGTGW